MDIVVVDSVAALVPRAEIEGEMGDSHVGLQARLMSQALRKLVGAVKTTDTSMIFTNQLRQRIGIMFGNPETTSGGMALKVLRQRGVWTCGASSRSNRGADVIGNRTRVTVRKNKVAARRSRWRSSTSCTTKVSVRRETCWTWVSSSDIIEKRGAFLPLQR